MASLASENCKKLRDAFEGQEAIYVEKGVLRVRVTNIRCNVDARSISASVEEIPTKGLERSPFHARRPDAPSPLRWSIRAGMLTSFSRRIWTMGYGGWSLTFGPDVVSGLARLAADWPAALDAAERYDRALRFLAEHAAHEPTTRVFPA